MKIHMDYLEGKIELLNSQSDQAQSEVEQMGNLLETANDKIKFLKESKERDNRDTKKSLNESIDRQKILEARNFDLERQLIDDRNYYTQKLMNQKSLTASTPESIIKFAATQSEIKNASQRSLKDANTNSAKNGSNSTGILTNQWIPQSGEAYTTDVKFKTGTDHSNFAKLTRKSSVIFPLLNLLEYAKVRAHRKQQFDVTSTAAIQ